MTGEEGMDRKEKISSFVKPFSPSLIESKIL
jgi:hypothetical protein